MKIELPYINIYYNECDMDYIDELITFLKKEIEEVVKFFHIQDFGAKVEVTLYDDLDTFRKYIKKIKKTDNIPDWLCGLSHNIYEGKVVDICFIEVLSLREYIKTESHETHTLNDLKYLILHEFVHASHRKYSKNNCYLWLSEGLATFLSHQYDNYSKHLEIKCSLDEMINGTKNYNNYYSMFVYVLNKYGKDYIFKLIDDYELLVKDTPRLYNEAYTYYEQA